MAVPLTRLVVLCAACAAICLAESAFAARSTEQSQTAKDATADVTSPTSGAPEATSGPVSDEQAVTSEQVVKSEPVKFSIWEEPTHVVKAVKPGETIEVHLQYSAGTPYEWKVVGGTAGDRPIPTDQPFDPAVKQVLQSLKDIGVETSKLSPLYSYLDDPKFERGFVGGPMSSKCIITSPQKPGVYRVAFAHMSFVEKDDAAAVRVVEIHVAPQQ